MRYLPELYYLQDQIGFPFQKAVLITAIAVSHTCQHYYANLITPNKNHADPVEKSGSLPTDPREKEIFITGLIQWLFDNSISEELFCLFLSAQPLSTPSPPNFDHHDDTCCWTLNISQNEFNSLQTFWSDHNIPADLFYPETHTICDPYPGTGLISWLLRAVGVQKCYTPKQWANR